MPTDRAFIEMTTVDSMGRPLNHISSSNTAVHQDDGASLRINLEGASHRRSYIFSYRLVQVVIVSIYLALLIHAVLTKGWWLYVNVPLGFGFTACVAAYFSIAFTAFRSFGYTERRVFTWKFACLIDAILFVLWGVTCISMCMPKGKDYKHLFDVPPYYAWYFAALFSLLSVLALAPRLIVSRATSETLLG